MLYYKALLEGLSPLPAADPAIRQQIEEEAIKKGWDELHAELQTIDPVSAARIHPNDPQRLSRALEVYRISGKTLTELTQTKGEQLPYRTLQFAIAPLEREILRQRIAERFHLMLSQGFEQEVRRLYQRGIYTQICHRSDVWATGKCGSISMGSSVMTRWSIAVLLPPASWQNVR